MKLRRVFLTVILAFLLIFVGGMLTSTSNAKDKDGNMIIVLDPGHSPGSPGASGNGLREELITLKIAQYMQDELEKYDGIKVYLTRYLNDVSIAERGEIIKDYNADVAFSIHINSSTSKSARGAEVYVTQDKKQVQFYQKSKEVGQKILANLEDLGLKNNGVKTRSGKNNEWYSDGTVADYYGIIRYPMKAGIPSILLEHCYISNSSDAKFIDSDSDLKKIAKADVAGIVKQYNLTLKSANKVPLNDITLSKSKVVLEKSSTTSNPTATLGVRYLPSNASNKTIDWYSSNTKVATVSNGKITGVGEGTATITAVTRNKQIVKTCKVTVRGSNKVYLKSFSLGKTSTTLNKGDTDWIKVIYNPTNVTDRAISWKSSNEKIATVSKGNVKAVGEGTATLTATSSYRGLIKTCKVTVKDPNKVYLKSFSLGKTSTTLNIGKTDWIKVIYNPTNVTDRAISWKSSNEKIATVSKGNIKAVGEGTATLTATSRDGKLVKTCKVTVKNPNKVYLKSFSLGKTNITLNGKGDTDWIRVIYNPTNATDRAISWKSSNEKIATVSKGDVKAVGVGTATLTATSRDGKMVKTCKVTVKAVPLKSFNLGKTSITLKVGATDWIRVIYTPSNTTNRVINWKSSNTKVVTVSKGDVKAVGKGMATLTATSSDGKITKTCRVTVK